MSTHIQIHSDSEDSDASSTHSIVYESNFQRFKSYSANSFTPYKIRELTDRGKKYMGNYGMVAYFLIFLTIIINMSAMIDRGVDTLVILNFIIINYFSLVNFFKIIASVLYLIFPNFR